MDEQIMRIKVITNKLLDAYLGKDVSWIDEGKDAASYISHSSKPGT